MQEARRANRSCILDQIISCEKLEPSRKSASTGDDDDDDDDNDVHSEKPSPRECLA
jgi:hypothetical protein